MMQVLGFMTGTSLDGIDVAMLETDDEAILQFGPHAEYPMPRDIRNLIEKAISEAFKWDGLSDEPSSFAPAREAITELHFKALQLYLEQYKVDSKKIDVLGVHGQTIFHQRPHLGQKGRTIQLFDPKKFAQMSNKLVVSDFRAEDVAQGGEGAPLAPVYHRALVRHANLRHDVVVVNLGGVANITAISNDDEIYAFDTGPANGLMDQLMRHHGVGDYDYNGNLAAQGSVNDAILHEMLKHPYFAVSGPKSLDRYDFSIDSVVELPIADGLATLSAFTVESLVMGIELAGVLPQTIVLTGGGRLNQHLTKCITKRLYPTKVVLAEDLGWRGGALEAEAFAYMAARRIKGLPISYPTTTGVPQPITGGVITAP